MLQLSIGLEEEISKNIKLEEENADLKQRYSSVSNSFE